MERTNVAVTQTAAANEVLRGVYNWMALGLGLTAVIAYAVAGSQSMMEFILGNQLVFFGMIIGELGLVFYLSARITKLHPATAAGLFMFYSALNGATLSVVLLVYSQAAVAQAFISCAVMFGAMSVYGYTTKKDLSSWGTFLFMGLIGVIIASVINIFIASSAMEFIISLIGVVVFTGPDRLRHPANQRDVGHHRLTRRMGRRSDQNLRGANPLPGLHQPVPDVAPLFRRVAGLMDSRPTKT